MSLPLPTPDQAQRLARVQADMLDRDRRLLAVWRRMRWPLATMPAGASEALVREYEAITGQADLDT